VGLQKAYNRNGRRITYGHSLALVVLVVTRGADQAKSRNRPKMVPCLLTSTDR